MRKLSKITIIAVVLLLVLPLAPVTASSPPLDVQFVLDSTWEDPPEGPISGTFVAWGPAVEAGLMCREGITINLGGFATPMISQGNYTYHLLKGFVCNDTNPETDWFIVRMEGRSDDVTATSTWVVWKASGIFAKLHGQGNATTEYDGPYQFVDTFTGQVHID